MELSPTSAVAAQASPMARLCGQPCQRTYRCSAVAALVGRRVRSRPDFEPPVQILSKLRVIGQKELVASPN